MIKPELKKRLNIAIIVSDYADELEVITLCSIFRLAKFSVKLLHNGPTEREIFTGLYGNKVQVDSHLLEVLNESFDLVCVPGGEIFSQYTALNIASQEFLEQHVYEKKLLALSGSSAYLIKSSVDYLNNAIFTCSPCFWDKISANNLRKKRVTYDKIHNLITSQGPGTVMELALEIIKLKINKIEASKIADNLIVWPNMHYGIMPK